MEAMGGSISIADSGIGFDSVNAMVDAYVKKVYKVYSGMLYCGHLSSKVQMYPPPSSSIRCVMYSYVTTYHTKLCIVCSPLVVIWLSQPSQP